MLQTASYGGEAGVYSWIHHLPVESNLDNNGYRCSGSQSSTHPDFTEAGTYTLTIRDIMVMDVIHPHTRQHVSYKQVTHIFLDVVAPTVTTYGTSLD